MTPIAAVAGGLLAGDLGGHLAYRAGTGVTFGLLAKIL
jgi:hypothetical protein